MTVQEGGTEYSLSSFQPSQQHIVQEGGTEARYCLEFNTPCLKRTKLYCSAIATCIVLFVKSAYTYLRKWCLVKCCANGTAQQCN